MKNKYATQWLKALKTPAVPSTRILHIAELKPGISVLLYCRVSHQNQRKKLPHQMSNLRGEAERRQLKIVDEVEEIASRDAECRFRFERTVSIAKHRGAVVLSESISRFIGCFGVIAERDEDTWERKYRRVLMPLNLRSFHKLMDMTEGVQLATIVHPDSTLAEESGYQKKRGQKGTGNKGGRPAKESIKERRLRLMPEAIKLWKDGFSYRQIGRRLGVPWSTVRDWIQRFKKSAHPSQHSESPEKP